MNANDIRMVEPRRRLRLRPEAEQVLGSGNGASEDHLEGHGPVKVRLIGFKDDPHATPSEFGQDLKLAELALHDG
jgi:hypothetical protein